MPQRLGHGHALLAEALEEPVQQQAVRVEGRRPLVQQHRAGPGHGPERRRLERLQQRRQVERRANQK